MSDKNNYTFNRTYDGDLISVGLSGFTKYSTEDDANALPPVGEILTPQTLADLLRKFNELLSSPNLQEAVVTLRDHMADMTNPHRVDLDQFMMDVGDALYGEFAANGGKCSKERYLNSLFETLYVASMDEMNNPEDRRAIISVSGATQFMRLHELDPEAHKELIDDLFPGTPLKDDPIRAFYTFTGIPPSYMKMDEYVSTIDYSAFTQVPYSYVGHDGSVHYCDTTEYLPMDYIHGEPYVPLFGTRVNHILESETLLSYKFTNVNVVHNSTLAPDKNMTASAVISNEDSMDAFHMISIPEYHLTPNTHTTFSVYAKAEDCDKLAISYSDNSGAGITTTGIFHLVDGYSMVTNAIESHTAHIHVLNNGWCRCSVTIFHTLGTLGKMELIFFKGDDTTLTYKADGSTCGYLWGLQLEDGPNASPYMPTFGRKAYRKPLFIQMPLALDGEDGRPKYTVAVGTRGIGDNKSWSEDRVIFSILDNDRFPTVIAKYTDHESILIERRTKTYTETEGVFIGTPKYSSSFEIPPNPLLQTIHGTDQARIISGANNAISEGIYSSGEWDMDNYLLIGTDNNGNYLDGYLRHALIYTFIVDKGEAKFINGDQVNESIGELR